jgi:hypothetical protein
LESDQSQIARVQEQISTPQSAWFLDQTEQPFEASFLHPRRGLAGGAGVKVKGRSDGKDREGESIAHLICPDLLARTTEACEHDSSAASPDLLDVSVLFGVGSRTKAGGSAPTYFESWVLGDQPLREGRKRFGGAAVEIDGQPFASGQPTHVVHQIGSIDPFGEANTMQPAKGPSDRLAIGDDHFEIVQSELELGVEDTLHDAVHCQSGDAERDAIARRGQHDTGGLVSFDRRDLDSQHRVALVCHVA